jgi:hypothetical protein
MRASNVKLYEFVDKKTGRKVVKAISTFEGKAVWASAQCDTSDEYNAPFGAALAENRLDVKITKKKLSRVKRKVKDYEDYVEFLKTEQKRAARTLAWAQGNVLDLRVELAELEREQKELLSEV